MEADMKRNIVYVGLDVDDTQYHGSALDKTSGEVIDFKCRPTLKGLLGQLDKLSKHFPGYLLRLCYEASSIGYTLQRDLAEKGYPCEVVAPTGIPPPRSKPIKTDRIDAAQLAQFYVNDLLSVVSVPDLQLEQDRDLMRSRQHLLQQQTELRKHVQALTCYKVIKHIFALTMITEIGDVNRFSHPRQRVSWIGMDIREHSSGGKPHRFGITKQGNRYLRTAFIEANQRGYRSARLSQAIKARRVDTTPEFIDIADRCLRRLNKKGNRLLLAGKHPNKVKVACAREMVGFVWESLHQAAA